MKIRDIEAIPFVLPYAKPFRMANGEVTEAAHVLVRVHTDEGVSGVAEAVSRPMIYGESQESIVAAVTRWLAPALGGADPFDVESAQRVLRSVAANETARGAVDLALHDIRGQAAGQPAWRLLGAAATSLRVTRMLSMGPPEAVVDEAVVASETYGITAFKVKVDNDVRTGTRLLEALRERLGPEAVLYADANQSLSLENALDLLRRTEPLGLAYIEEPVAADDLVARARIAAAGRVPVMADESARTVEEAARQLTAGSARALSVKTARTGFTESARILGLAQGLHSRTVIGSQGDSALGATAAAAFGAAFATTSREPAELDYFLGLRDQIVTGPPVVSGGRISVNTTRPGIGARIDEDKLAHYRTDGRT